MGVKRQQCGQLGKVANCQAGIFLGYASQYGNTRLNYRLYMPREWIEAAAYAERMVIDMAQSGHLRCRWLTGDQAFDRHPGFLDEVAPWVWYLAEVPENNRVWLKRPQAAIPIWSNHRRKPACLRLVEEEPQFQPVVEIALRWPADQWQRLVIKEGTKGPITADFFAQRRVNGRNNLPGQTVWLICRREADSGEFKFYLSNASRETVLAGFAQISGMRRPIEACSEEGKQELGLGNYQIRIWVGWHHYMTLFCIPAHFSLVPIQRRLQNKVPNITLPQAILLLKSVLPQPKFDVEITV